MFPQHLGRGERTCLAWLSIRHAMLATDDHLARRAAQTPRDSINRDNRDFAKLVCNLGYSLQLEAQQKLDQMIAAGYYSPVLKLDID